ncbi:(d)CMP kinase, partial [Murimonas intestini]
VDCTDEAALEEVCRKISIELAYEDGEQQVILNGENVTPYIRTEEVSQMTSRLSARPAVRAALLNLQRRLAEEQDVLMDGRDIGTQVLPDAQLKIYLTASPAARAKRRYLEYLEKGDNTHSLEEIERTIAERDERDMNREIAPLKQADDAVLVDTSDMGIEEVTSHIISLYEEKKAAAE